MRLLEALLFLLVMVFAWFAVTSLLIGMGWLLAKLTALPIALTSGLASVVFLAMSLFFSVKSLTTRR